MDPYTPDQIVELYKLMSKLGGPYGIIRQTEFFIYSQKDREALERCRDLGLRFPEITTWIRATKEDFRLVRDLGIRETGILVSCSDYHIFKKMKLTRAQAMKKYLETVGEAFEAGVMPRCHLEDITRADFYGFVVPFVNEPVSYTHLDFFLSLGFGRVRFSTPQEHDEMIALTSQLAHIVSSAYVKSPLAARHKGFSAGSFLDMTRVARLNEDMWTELFFDNADMLSQEPVSYTHLARRRLQAAHIALRLPGPARQGHRPAFGGQARDRPAHRHRDYGRGHAAPV